jgi:hypothetical protein
MRTIFAVCLTVAVALPVVFQTSSADAKGYICRLGGHWYSGRCPDYVNTNGRWYHNRVYCLRTGRYGHC